MLHSKRDVVIALGRALAYIALGDKSISMEDYGCKKMSPIIFHVCRCGSVSNYLQSNECIPTADFLKVAETPHDFDYLHTVMDDGCLAPGSVFSQETCKSEMTRLFSSYGKNLTQIQEFLWSQCPWLADEECMFSYLWFMQLKRYFMLELTLRNPAVVFLLDAFALGFNGQISLSNHMRDAHWKALFCDTNYSCLDIFDAFSPTAFQDALTENAAFSMFTPSKKMCLLNLLYCIHNLKPKYLSRILKAITGISALPGPQDTKITLNFTFLTEDSGPGSKAMIAGTCGNILYLHTVRHSDIWNCTQDFLNLMHCTSYGKL